MRKVIPLLVFAFFSTFTFLQAQHTIKGKIVDEEGESLPSVTVMLLNAEDSVLRSFAMTNATGDFSLRSVPSGKFILKATFSGMNNLNLTIEVQPEPKDVDLGTLKFTRKSTELGAVEITAEIIPIQIKGDTIEYNANAFKTQPNATVEDLLKRLPGMEVDAEGNVKAQGETVTKVFVDGKQFFGTDPKIATKNLPADAIDKVKVYDKSSDMSEFTGVDDGERVKTINLTLKANRKNGIFGDVSGGYGYGTNHLFRGKANINRFSKNSQLSFLGMGNNINEQAFSMMDYINFVGGAANAMQQNGMAGGNRSGSSSTISPQDLGLSFRGNAVATPSGINTSAAGGLNYNVSAGKKTGIQSSYFYNFNRLDLVQQTYRENAINAGGMGEQSFITQDTSSQLDLNHNNRLNLRVEHDIDSSARLIFDGSGRFNLTNGDKNSVTNSLQESTLLNSNERSQITTGNNLNTSATLEFMKRFASKPGRSFSLQGNFSYVRQPRNYDILSNQAIRLDSLNWFFDTLNQNQNELQTNITYGGRATYSEPIGKGKFLEFLYSHKELNQNLGKDFFNITVAETQSLDSSLSSRYDGIYRFDNAEGNFRIVTKKSNLKLGIAGQRSELRGSVGFQDSTISKVFYNPLPTVRYTYTIKQGSRLRFSYTTAVNAPSISQLQPVVDNSNPLNLYVGNPDLKQEYAHSFSANYLLFDQFSFLNLFTMVRATFTQNKISTAITIDPFTLKQLSTPVNVSRDFNLNWFANFGTPIRKLGVKINLSPTINWINSITLLNGQENVTNTLISAGDFSVENRKKEKFDLSVGTRISHTLTQYNIRPELGQEFLNYKFYGALTVYLPKGFTINSAFNYYLYTGGGQTTNQSVPLWTAYVSKTFLKGEKGEFKLTGYDLLNLNRGIDRSTSVNYLQETRYNTLQRYVMLSFTYKIMAIPKGKEKKTAE